MTFGTLIRRSLRFHARAHLGMVLGAAIGSAALIGALIVGDSVKQTLRERALSRLGDIHFAMSTGDRFFLSDLAGRLGADAKPAASYKGSGALLVSGTGSRQDGAARANRVSVIGVDASTWPRLARWQESSQPDARRIPNAGEDDEIRLIQHRLAGGIVARWQSGEIVLVNEVLARELALHEGDEIILRIRKPSALAQDAVITPRDESAVALRVKVGPILPASLLGNFSLSANPLPPANAFLSLSYLAKQLGLEGRANLTVDGSIPAIADEAALPWLNAQVQRAWSLEDAQLSVRAIEPPPTATGGEHIRPFVEITSSRIFLEPPVVAAALRPRTVLLTNHHAFAGDSTNDLAFSQMVTNGVGMLTYLANLISVGDRAAPYSMVTAAKQPYLPADMLDHEILVNEWLAEDLQVKPGDSVALSYYVVDSGSRLLERTNSFRVRAIVPLKGIYADRTLMPDFPGVARAESTHDWDAGFPLVYNIRDKDEAYWKKYRGTPKAFITLAAGQSMWANRFGQFTAIRYEVPANSLPSACRDDVYRNLLANLDPAEFGLSFEPVRAQALKAAEQSQDFGQLFLGFSIFLVVAALLLMALLFQLGIEQRLPEVGTLLALGFTARQVRRLLLVEGAALALAGGVVGAAGGIGYAKAMLWGLATVWHSAVGGSALQFHASTMTIIIGLCASSVIAILTIWLTLRKQARRPARELLAGEGEGQRLEVGGQRSVVRSRSIWVGLALVSGAAAIIAWVLSKGDSTNAEAFFGAGALLLVAGLAFASAWFKVLARGTASLHLTLARLGVRGCARRNKRSLTTVALLACGCFVIVAIGVFRLDANQDAAKRASGTGGFALIGNATIPVVQDLNTKAGREFFGLGTQELAAVEFVPFRVHEGDDASCLNLNRAQKPRLLGIRPELLAERGAFTFKQTLRDIRPKNPWLLLKSEVHGEAGVAGSIQSPSLIDTTVSAIGDANSIEWALGKKVGETLDYTDEHGRTFKLRLVGAVANSILQGNLIIDEAEFVKRFPSESGYRMFLIDTPSNSVAQVSATLARALQDFGLELAPAVDRLNAFNAVQNTYLGTFQILGGLGLLLGSAGLGIVVLRNVLERRGELGLLVALGFRRRALQKLVLSEHAALLGLGLGLGIVAAAIAVLPALLSPGTHLAYVSLALTMGAVLVNGLAWTWLATRYALRGNLLEALRNE